MLGFAKKPSVDDHGTRVLARWPLHFQIPHETPHTARDHSGITAPHRAQVDAWHHSTTARLHVCTSRRLSVALVLPERLVGVPGRRGPDDHACVDDARNVAEARENEADHEVGEARG